MDAIKDLINHRIAFKKRRDPDAIDALALQVTKDINSKRTPDLTRKSVWEHEELAKVKIMVLRGHKDEVNKCQFFYDDSLVLTASSDCTIKVWSSSDGEELYTLNDAHAVNCADAHVMEDGSSFISCGWDKRLCFWDLEIGKPIWTSKHRDRLTCCNLSFDHYLVCVGTDLFHELYIYDTRTGQVTQKLQDYHKFSVTSCCFTPDNTRVITTSTDRTAKFYDLRTDTSTITLQGHTNAISSCSITLDQRKLATASWDKTIMLWDVATGSFRSKGATVLKGSHEGSVICCSFSDEGLLLASGSADHSIVVWDVESNSQKLKLHAHAAWVTDVHFSKDNKWLLSSSQDGTVKMFDIEHSDQIPQVVESQKSQGLKVVKCRKCGKPFSTCEWEAVGRDVVGVCVFCRLQNPEQSWLVFRDEPVE